MKDPILIKDIVTSLSVTHCFKTVLVIYTGGTIGMTKEVTGVYQAKKNVIRKSLKNSSIFNDEEFIKTHLKNLSDQPFVLPGERNKFRIMYDVIEYENLMDSANMNVKDWNSIAKTIKDNYSHFNGFVVLHGTDTMSYTASALSFMLENLGKPIVLTGSQVPLFEIRSDGRNNFINSLFIAGYFNIPEVVVSFNNRILRGNRTTKQDTSAFDAFSSDNLTPLVEFGINITFHERLIQKATEIKPFSIFTTLSEQINILNFTPGIYVNSAILLFKPPIKGVIILSFGAGNGPHKKLKLMEAIKDAVERQVIVLNISQCPRGSISVSYAPGKALMEIGVVLGGDMTLEAAYTKMCYVLGKNISYSEKCHMMASNLRGELTVIQDHSQFKSTELTNKISDAIALQTEQEKEQLFQEILPYLICSAARDADMSVLQQILYNGGVNAQDYDGRSALHIAASEGHLEVCNFLIKHGAIVHVIDRFGHTPLDNAIKFQFNDVIELLINTGSTLVEAQVGAIAMNQYGLFKSYIHAGANVNSSDYLNNTPLHVATNKHDCEAVEFLLTFKPDVTLKNLSGESALEIARTKCRSCFMKIK